MGGVKFGFKLTWVKTLQQQLKLVTVTLYRVTYNQGANSALATLLAKQQLVLAYKMTHLTLLLLMTWELLS
jgi:hypothetical protein